MYERRGFLKVLTQRGEEFGELVADQRIVSYSVSRVVISLKLLRWAMKMDPLLIHGDGMSSEQGPVRRRSVGKHVEGLQVEKPCLQEKKGRMIGIHSTGLAHGSA